MAITSTAWPVSVSIGLADGHEVLVADGHGERAVLEDADVFARDGAARRPATPAAGSRARSTRGRARPSAAQASHCPRATDSSARARSPDEGRRVERDAEEEREELGRHGDAAGDLQPLPPVSTKDSPSTCDVNQEEAAVGGDQPGRSGRPRDRRQFEHEPIPEHHVQQHRHIAHQLHVAGAQRARQRVARGRPRPTMTPSTVAATIAATVIFSEFIAPAMKARGRSCARPPRTRAASRTPASPRADHRKSKPDLMPRDCRFALVTWNISTSSPASTANAVPGGRRPSSSRDGR